MGQERKRYFSFGEKFEDGVLRADACQHRYSMPRDMQYRTYSEDLPSRSFGMSAVREERRLMEDARWLIASGFQLKASETLENFVARHSDFLGKEVV